MAVKWKYRNRRNLDAPYVWETVARSIRGAPPYCWLESKEWRRLAERLKAPLGDCELEVACSEEDEDYIAGFCAHAGSAVLFVYVRDIYRGKGLGTELLNRAIDDCAYSWTYAHREPRSRRWLKSRGGRYDLAPMWFGSESKKTDTGA